MREPSYGRQNEIQWKERVGMEKQPQVSLKIVELESSSNESDVNTLSPKRLWGRNKDGEWKQGSATLTTSWHGGAHLKLIMTLEIAAVLDCMGMNDSQEVLFLVAAVSILNHNVADLAISQSCIRSARICHRRKAAGYIKPFMASSGTFFPIVVLEMGKCSQL